VVAAADAGPESVDDAKDTYEVVMQKAERARVNERSKIAHELFVKATKMKPNAPRPWLGMGWTAVDLGKYSVAIKAFNRALALDESLADAHLGLAEAYRYSGSKAKALDSYQTYLKINPTGKDAEVARRAIEMLKE
jgi:tetratricopeptide (TPR) repeat protein